MIEAFYITNEGVIDEFSRRNNGTSWIVSTFAVVDCDNEAQTESEKHVRSCVNAASGE